MNITNNFLGKLLFSFSVLLLVICGVSLLLNDETDILIILLLFMYIPLFLSASVTKSFITIFTGILAIAIIYFILPEVDSTSAYIMILIFTLYIPVIVFAFYSEQHYIEKNTSITAGTIISLSIVYITIISVVLQLWHFSVNEYHISYYIKSVMYMLGFIINSSAPELTAHLNNVKHLIDLSTQIIPSIIVIMLAIILYLNFKIATKIINNRSNYKTIKVQPKYELAPFYNIICIFMIILGVFSYNFLETSNFLLYIVYHVLFTLWLGYACCGVYYIRSYIIKQNIFVAVLLVVISILLLAEIIVLASFIGFFASITSRQKK